ncbi:MAG: hypothetical protein ABIR34_12310 [Marmoricola sp.]
MTPNVSFALLDTAVIGGRGDDPVLPGMTHARMLEEVAALGGVVWHLGVRPGLPVVIDLEPDLAAVVAALAVARIGGIVSPEDHPDAPVALVSSGSEVPSAGRVRIVRGGAVSEPDLEWNVMMRAGRTDPAAAQVLDPGSAYSPERSVREQIEVLAGTPPPYSAAELRRLLQV